MEVLYDSIITRVASGELSPVYGRNLTRKILQAPSFLRKMPLHVDPARNRDLDPMIGINRVTYYLSGFGSFTDAHCEDGGLDSLNIMQWGEPSAVKRWLCISAHDFGRVAKRLARLI